jgi:class 3 adenylate cyclase
VSESAHTRYAKCDDVHIAYEALGTGPLDLLVIAGSAVPIDSIKDEPSIDRFQRRLASFSRLVRFDLRGTGLSDPVSPSSPPTLEQWMQDAVAVMDAVGSERAAVFAVMGGAAPALLLAATHPERVQSLIVVNGWARMTRAPDYPAGIPQRLLDAARGVGTELDAIDQGYDALALRAPSVADNDAFRSWWDRAGNRGASPAMARAIASVLWQADVRELLPLVQVPTLVVHRRDNPFMRVGHGHYLAEHIPGARYVELTGADDLYWVGDTDSLIEEIEEFLTGVRHGPGRDRMLATVLFTDIVASTERLVELGDPAWRNLLDSHDLAVRRQLKRFRGNEIKTTGDGVLATFDGPARAVHCACAIRNAASELGLQVRSGVHAGEVEIRGDDIGGLPVHIAARVTDLASGHEILVTSTVKDLVAGSGIQFADRGSHVLKGIPDAWQVFAVDDP